MVRRWRVDYIAAREVWYERGMSAVRSEATSGARHPDGRCRCWRRWRSGARWGRPGGGRSAQMWQRSIRRVAVGDADREPGRMRGHRTRRPAAAARHGRLGVRRDRGPRRLHHVLGVRRRGRTICSTPTGSASVRCYVALTLIGGYVGDGDRRRIGGPHRDSGPVRRRRVARRRCSATPCTSCCAPCPALLVVNIVGSGLLGFIDRCRPLAIDHHDPRRGVLRIVDDLLRLLARTAAALTARRGHVRRRQRRRDLPRGKPRVVVLVNVAHRVAVGSRERSGGVSRRFRGCGSASLAGRGPGRCSSGRRRRVRSSGSER